MISTRASSSAVTSPTIESRHSYRYASTPCTGTTTLNVVDIDQTLCTQMTSRRTRVGRELGHRAIPHGRHRAIPHLRRRATDPSGPKVAEEAKMLVLWTRLSAFVGEAGGLLRASAASALAALLFFVINAIDPVLPWALVWAPAVAGSAFLSINFWRTA